MWLLELHFSTSILCLLTFFGFYIFMISQIRANGWLTSKKKKSLITLVPAFFVPGLNIAIIFAMFLMVSLTKREFDSWCDDRKQERDARNGKDI